MKTVKKLSAIIFGVALLLGGIARAQTSGVLYFQSPDGQSTYGPSELWAASGVNSEIADDFNVIANIDRVYASGFVWGAVNFQGVYVRFYQYGADNKPGALQREYFLAASDPNLTFDSLSGAIDAKLSSAFPATGRHFLSVQPVINYWYWWSANINAPLGQAFYFRNNTIGEAWHHGDNLNLNANADVSFYLYGTVTGAGIIDSLSTTTLPRSGFLEIFGSNFGGDGTVFIGGIRAPVADWSSTRIVAYIPETAPLSTVNVKVVTAAGTSNLKPLTVTTRPAAAGRVNWRFRMDGPYSEVRAAVGPDQTVYAIDAFFHLYALAPDGALKWLVRGAGDKGVAVGPDGIIYVASESFINAFNPDGSAKWRFVQNPRAMICLGVSVGPDGNIYSVGTEGLGVFSLTPAGALRWQQPEGYARPIVDYGEIVFGPNGSQQQLYFYANNHLRAVRLDGASVFENSSGLVSQLKPGLQPVVSPDGSVHTVLSAYMPNGTPLWTFPTPYPYNVFTPADIGSDGIHYFVQNLSQIFALNPNGSQRWHVTSTNYLAGPIVGSLNSQLIMGSADTLDHAGFILSASAKDGHELWRVTLPAEDPTVFNSALGIFGFNQLVSARARFTADGQTAYVMTATATGDNNTSRSFVYSLNASLSAPPTPTPTPTPPATALRSTSINLSATLLTNNQVSVNGIVAVKDVSGAPVPGATAAVTWTKPSGTTVNQTASSDSNGRSNFSIKGARGTYTLRVNNITKAGYTFDKTSSVLSKSITK
jgi:IPT/TIG domain